MMDFSSRQLRAFLLVAQHRSFSRAAEALFITPSGLSVMIRELEGQLGFRLFDRTSRHVALTSYGGELLTVAQSCLDQFDTAIARLGRAATQGQARFCRLVRRRWLPPMFCREPSKNSGSIGRTSESMCLTVITRPSCNGFRTGNSTWPSVRSLRVRPVSGVYHSFGSP